MGLAVDAITLSAWGANVIQNMTGKVAAPYWRLEPYEATLNYTCSRAFVALGLLNDPA